MFKTQLSVQQWLQLPLDIRLKLIELFNIPRSEGAHIQNDRVLSDGHNYRDLEAITIEKMQNYLGEGASDEFFDLFELVVKQLEDSKKTAVEDAIKAVASENIAKWLMLMRDIKRQAIELHLDSQLKELLVEIFGIESRKESPMVNMNEQAQKAVPAISTSETVEAADTTATSKKANKGRKSRSVTPEVIS